MEGPRSVNSWFPTGGKTRKEKDQRNRENGYLDWLEQENKEWFRPNFEEYEAYLRDVRGLSRSSIVAHLSTIRTRYRKLLKEGILERELRAVLAYLDEHDLEQMVNEFIAEIEQASAPEHTSGKIRPKKAKYTRLSAKNIVDLHRQIMYNNDLRSQRDRAVLGLLFGVGLRQNEAANLSVADLNRKVDGRNAIYVKPGYGQSERYIVYDDRMPWVKQWLDSWLEAAKITEGAVLRGFSRYQTTIRQDALSPRTIERLLADYPIVQGTKTVQVRPMDLRRAHGRMLFEVGENLPDIQARLGLRDANAVIAYIGDETASLLIGGSRNPFEYFREQFE